MPSPTMLGADRFGVPGGTRNHTISRQHLKVVRQPFCHGHRSNWPSNQLQPFQARVTVLADDDVIVHRNAERAGNVDDGLGHLDIGLRRRRIAGRMVVHWDDGGG